MRELYACSSKLYKYPSLFPQINLSQVLFWSAKETLGRVFSLLKKDNSLLENRSNFQGISDHSEFECDNWYLLPEDLSQDKSTSSIQAKKSEQTTHFCQNPQRKTKAKWLISISEPLMSSIDTQVNHLGPFLMN